MKNTSRFRRTNKSTRSALCACGLMAVVPLLTLPGHGATFDGNIEVVNANTNAVLGFVSPTQNGFGEFVIQASQAGSLEVSFSNSSTPFSVGIVSVTTPSSAAYPFFGGIVGFSNTSDNLGAGNPNYAYAGSTVLTAAGAGPTVGANSFTNTTSIAEKVESTIWSFNAGTRVLSPQWINTDLSSPATSVVDITGIIVFTGDTTAFTNTFGANTTVKLVMVGAPLYWLGGTSGSWTGNVNNWASNAGGTPTTQIPSALSDVTFSATGATRQGATTLDQDFTIHTLTVTDTTPVVISSGVGGTHTLTIAGDAGTGIIVGNGANMTINSNVTLGGASDTIEVDGTGQGVINGVLGGSNGLIKTGTGMLILNNNGNNYTGATTINGGTLYGGVDNAFVATSVTTVNAGGTLDLGTHSQTINTVNLAGGTIQDGSLTGAITSTGGNINGIGGSATLTTTSGTTFLFGTNTYTGNTTVNGGTLAGGGANTFSATSATTINTGGVVDLGATTQTINTVNLAGGTIQNGSLTGAITSTGGNVNGIGGSATLTTTSGSTFLFGTNTYTGNTTVNGGTLAGGGANTFSAASATTINTGGVVDLGATTQTINTVNLAGGTIQNGSLTGAITSTGGNVNGVGGSATLTTTSGSTFLFGTNTYTGNTTVNGGTLAGGGANTFSAASATTINTGGVVDLGATTQTINAVNLAGGTIQNGSLTGAIASTGGNVNGVGGSATLTTTSGSTFLFGTNTYTGNTTVNGGTLAGGGANTFSAASATTINTGGVVDLGATTQTINTVNLAGGTIQNGSLTGAITSTGGNVNGVAGSATLTTTSGSTFLFGTNTYTGNTTVNGGTLAGGGANTFSAASATTINTGGVVDLGATAQTINTVNLAGGTIQNGSLTGAITSTGGNVNGVGGLATLTNTSGSTFLFGTNTYTGATTVNGGTLFGTAANTFSAASATTINTGGTVDLSGFAQTINTVALAGGTIKNGSLTGAITSTGGTVDGINGSASLTTTAGTTVVTGTNGYTGVTNVDGGTLQVDGSIAAASTVNVQGTLTGSGTINGNATLSKNGIINLGSTGNIVGTLGVTGGQWLGQGTVKGLVTSSSGTFLIGTGANLTATTGVNLTGGTLGGGGTIVGPVTLNSGATIAPGVAAHGTTLHASSLLWNGGGTLSLQLGTADDQLALTGALTKGTSGSYTLDLTSGAGFGSQNSYLLATFGSTNFLAGDFTLSLPAGVTGTLLETSTSLSIVDLLAAISGNLIQNVGGPNTPIFADFTVVGAGKTGTPAASNTVNSLIMPDGSSLLIFNTLTLTSGNVSQPGGTATITGGTLFGPNGLHFDVDGNLFIGSTLIGNATKTGNGNLYLDSTLFGNLDVLAGLLGGNGTIFGNLFNAGTVSPGHSPGQIHVTGNYTQTSTGTLRIEIGGRDISQHDLLSVGGAAYLDGTLQLVRLNNYKLKRNKPITFLTADGGVNGTFSTVQNDFANDSNTILQPGVVYHRTSVDLELVQGSFEKFAGEWGLTPNEKAVAHALDKGVNDRHIDNLITYLDGRELRKLPGDFDKISPEELTSLSTIGVALEKVQSQNLQRRADDIRSGLNGFHAAGLAINGNGPSYSGNFGITTGVAGPTGKESKESKEIQTVAPEENRWGVFLSGTGEWVSVGDTENARGYNLDTGGFTLGIDYKVTPHFAIGIAAGYTGTTADLTNRGRVWVNGGKLGIYSTIFSGGWYADIAAFGGYNSYDTRRGALRGEARGDTDGGEINALFGTGYDIKAGGLTFGPTATFNYTNVGTNGFTEHGSLAPLEIHGNQAESLRTAFGLKASYDWKLGGVLIRPEIRASWQHEFGDSVYTLDSSFAGGAGGAFTAAGPKLGRDSALLGAGFAVQFNERMSTYFYYDGELGRTNYQSNSVTGGVRLTY